MALVWVDGFDNYGTTEGNLASPSGILGRKYTWSGNWRVVAPRIAGNGHAIRRESGNIVTPVLTTDDTLIVGIGMYIYRTAASGVVLEWFHSSTQRFYLYFRLEAGEMELWHNKSPDVLLGSIRAQWCSWQYLEIKLDSSAGTAVVHLNGSQVISVSGLSFDSINESLRIGYQTMPIFDDLYVCDGAGSKNNTFLGSRKVVAIRPDGAGDQTDWTPSAGSNYGCVDEEECNDDADYVSETDTDETDLYGYDAVSSDLSEADGMMLCADTRKEVGADFNLRLPVKLSATVDEGSSIVVSETAYTTKSRISEDKPGGGDWTPSDVDSAQVGVRVPS